MAHPFPVNWGPYQFVPGVDGVECRQLSCVG
jgi:hypothetical protein